MPPTSEPGFDRTKTLHINQRLAAASHKVRTVLHHPSQYGFSTDTYAAEQFKLETRTAIDDMFVVMQSDFEDIPIRETVISRLAVAHLFGDKLIEEHAHKQTFEDLFAATLNHFNASVMRVGTPRTLDNGTNRNLWMMFNDYEPYLPPSVMRQGESSMLAAYAGGSALTALLIQYVRPEPID